MESPSSGGSPLQFPAGLRAFLDSASLLPPVPLQALPHLQQLSENFFATDSRELPLPPFAPEDLDEFFSTEDGTEKNGGIGYFALGLTGYGLQSTEFSYLLDAGTLKLAFCLPWNRIYGSAEEEGRTLEEAFQLARLCQLCRPEKQQLGVLLDTEGCRWILREKEEVIAEGDELSSLLDRLQLMLSDNTSEARMQWLRI